MLNKIRTMFFFFVFSFENKALLDLMFQGLHGSTNSPAKDLGESRDRVSSPVPLISSQVSFSFKTNKARHVYTGY